MSQMPEMSQLIHQSTSVVINAQRARILREVEAAALHDLTGKLPWRPSWAAYFGDRAGLLDALATRRQCLALIDVSTLPDVETRDMVARRLERATAGLERILRRYGQLVAA